MNHKFSLLGVLCIFISCNSQLNNSASVASTIDSSKAEPAEMLVEDWVSLFDGKTTKGWHSYGRQKAGERWKIAGGAVYLDTSKGSSASMTGGDLVSDKEYQNFHLKLDWKIAPNGNSGIIFYVHEDTAKYKATYNTGPEMQVIDNNGHPDGKIFKHRSGDLYDLIASSKESTKPVGEWNEAEIISKNGKLELILNGTTVVSTVMWDENWSKLVAGSKFKSMPGFGIFKKGRIALQDHGNMVWYKNIKIKEFK